MPGRVLLDVNLWIALLDEAHVHNRKARALMKRPGLRIATCPLIETARTVPLSWATPWIFQPVPCLMMRVMIVDGGMSSTGSRSCGNGISATSCTRDSSPVNGGSDLNDFPSGPRISPDLVLTTFALLPEP